MKEPKVKTKELKLHIEELEERIAPDLLIGTPQGTVTAPANSHAFVAAGNGVVTDEGGGCVPPDCGG